MPGYCCWCRWAPDVWCRAFSCLGTRLGGSKMHALSPVRIYSHKSSGTYLQYIVSSSCVCRLEQCYLRLHVANRHISGRYRQQLSQLFSLRCHSHCDVIGAMTYGHTDTLPCLIYRDICPVCEIRQRLWLSGWDSDCHVGNVQLSLRLKRVTENGVHCSQTLLHHFTKSSVTVGVSGAGNGETCDVKILSVITFVADWSREADC